MGYGIAKRFSKKGANFGKANWKAYLHRKLLRTVGCAALLPMMALGIPGSATAAVLLGGLMIWGLRPGPLLFVEQKDFVWG